MHTPSSHIQQLHPCPPTLLLKPRLWAAADEGTRHLIQPTVHKPKPGLRQRVLQKLQSSNRRLRTPLLYARQRQSSSPWSSSPVPAAPAVHGIGGMPGKCFPALPAGPSPPPTHLRAAVEWGPSQPGLAQLNHQQQGWWQREHNASQEHQQHPRACGRVAGEGGAQTGAS